MRIFHHRDDEKHEVEQPVWQASKPAWGVVSIDAPKAIDLRESPDRAA